MFLNKRFVVLCLFIAIFSQVAVAETRKLVLDPSKNLKNLSTSYFGADAEDFKSNINFKWLLNEGRDEFADYCRKTGTRVLRFATMSRYSIHGEFPTRMIRARMYARQDEKKYQKYMAKELNWWFKPDSFYSFCKENNIKVMPMFNGRAVYDTQKKKDIWVVNNPEAYPIAAKEAADHVKWVKDNGYLDIIYAWEIGNECYYHGWKTEEFVKFVRCLVAEVRKIDSDIKLALPIFVFNPKDQDYIWQKKNMKGLRTLDGWKRWTLTMLRQLGADAKYISYGAMHTYGGSLEWASNYRSIVDHEKLINLFPATRHWKLLNTEWRHQSVHDQVGHWRFNIGGLWNTKYAMSMMAHPRMGSSFIHSFLWFGGLGAWSNGESWIQRPWKGRKRGYVNDPLKKKRLAIGPFAEPMRMCNTMVDKHPIMIQHYADLGNYSSAFYFDNPAKMDIQYIAAVNPKRTSLSMVFINTFNRPVEIKLALKDFTITYPIEFEKYWCDQNKINKIHDIGDYSSFHFEEIEIKKGKLLILPPKSICKIRAAILKDSTKDDNKGTE